MYKVIRFFTDLEDNNHPYEIGQTYPREGLEVSKARLDELSSNKNKQGIPLIVSLNGTNHIIEEESKEVKTKEVKKTEVKPKAKKTTSKKKKDN